MQNVNTFDEYYASEQATWIKLWWKNWNYSHWLMTSVITTVITSEIYTIILSVYPHFLTAFWFNLGISSFTFAAILSLGTLLGLGLLTGWMIYSSHLLYDSLHIANHDYQPLVELWTNYNQEYSYIVNQLMSDDSFMKFSQYLKSKNLPEPIARFLGNVDNIDQIKKVSMLLKRIWDIENVDEKLKELAINILSEYAHVDSTAEHIDNIWSLCNLLLDKKQFNQNTVLRTIENSNTLKPYLPRLQHLNIHQDLLYKLIDEPQLMTFFLAHHIYFDREDERVLFNMDILYIYMRNELNKVENFQTLQSAIPQKLLITSDTYRYLLAFKDKPEAFVVIWDHLLHLEPLGLVDSTFQFINSEPAYQKYANQAELWMQLTALLDKNPEDINETFNQLINTLNTDDVDYKKQFYNVLVQLYECKALHKNTMHLFLTSPDVSGAIERLEQYVKTRWSPDKSFEDTIKDLETVVIKPEPNLPKSIEMEAPQLFLPSESPKKGGNLFFNCITCSSADSPSHYQTPRR